MTASGWCAPALVLAVGWLGPVPIGAGPAYRPPARSPAARFACRPAPLHAGVRFHLELFAQRRVVIVPAAIGLAGARFRFGRVVRARCRGRLWTLDPSGVVRFDRPARLGELFAVWGQRLGPSQLASFGGRVTIYVDGARWRGDPRALRLRDGDEVVLEVGGFVAPHRSFRFPP